jgi:hypothetical protein
MQKPPSEDVEKIQELLPDYSEAENVILWYMQYRDSKIRIVEKRIHKRQ